MKNLYQKWFNHITMNWTHSKFRTLCLNILYTLIYEKISLSFKLSERQRLGIRVVGSFVIIFTFFYGLGIITTSQAYLNTKNELNIIYEEKEHKQTVIEKLKDKFDNLFYNGIDSREYRVKKIYEESGIEVPNSLPDSILNTMCTTADYYGIPYKIWFRLLAKESYHLKKFNVSNKGALYWAQVTPQTFSDYSKNLFIKKHTQVTNIKVAGLILHSHYQKYKRWDLALSAYNAGRGNVKDSQIPNFKETKDYVRFILK